MNLIAFVKRFYGVFCAIILLAILSYYMVSGTREDIHIDDLASSHSGVYKLNYISLEEFNILLNVMEIKVVKRNIYNDNLVYIQFYNHLHVDRVNKLLALFDIPPVQISIEVELAKGLVIEKPEYPMDNPVLQQLQQTFNFGGIQSIAKGVITASSGMQPGFGLTLVADTSTKSPFQDCNLSIQNVQYVPDGRGVIKLHDIILQNYNGKNTSSLIGTSLNIKNGDTVIVGSNKINGSTYFLILKATVVK